MAAAVSVSSPLVALQLATITGSGFANDTAYTVVVTGQQGNRTLAATSDGSGDFTVTYTPNSKGNAVIDVFAAPAGSLASASITVADS